jgi:hypothetical protein
MGVFTLVLDRKFKDSKDVGYILYNEVNGFTAHCGLVEAKENVKPIY